MCTRRLLFCQRARFAGISPVSETGGGAQNGKNALLLYVIRRDQTTPFESVATQVLLAGGFLACVWFIVVHARIGSHSRSRKGERNRTREKTACRQESFMHTTIPHYCIRHHGESSVRMNYAFSLQPPWISSGKYDNRPRRRQILRCCAYLQKNTTDTVDDALPGLEPDKCTFLTNVHTQHEKRRPKAPR